jgi:hypothetical protein
VSIVKIQSIVGIVAAGIGLFVSQAARADTLFLRDRVLYGTILAETVSGFRFRVNCNRTIIFIRKAVILGAQRDRRCA